METSLQRSGFAMRTEDYELLRREHCLLPTDGNDLPVRAPDAAIEARWPGWTAVRAALTVVADGLVPPVPDALLDGVALAVCNRVAWFRRSGVLEIPHPTRPRSPALARLAQALHAAHEHLSALSPSELDALRCHSPTPRSSLGNLGCALVLPEARGGAAPETLPDWMVSLLPTAARVGFDRSRRNSSGRRTAALVSLRRNLDRMLPRLLALSGPERLRLSFAPMPLPETDYTGPVEVSGDGPLRGEAARAALRARLAALAGAAETASAGRSGQTSTTRPIRLLIEALACHWAALTGQPPGAGGKRGDLRPLVEDVLAVIRHHPWGTDPATAPATGGVSHGEVGKAVREAMRSYRGYPGFIPTEGHTARIRR